MSRPVRCVIMRGGTSRAVFLREVDLPLEHDALVATVLAIFGSPDARQIDGLGGADPLTSKVAIIGPARPRHAPAAGAQLTYTFGQVGIDRPEIDFLSLCGNISSAVGAFAIDEGFVEPSEPMTTVRVYNTNLDSILTLEVPVEGRRARECGDYAVPGVPGTGAKILVDLAATAGKATGALLPTGASVDWLVVPGVGRIQASLVDVGNAHVFVRARDVGLTGTETAAAIDADGGLRGRLEAIRGVAASRLGMAADPARAAEESPATPLLGLVGPPADYWNEIGRCQVGADDVDVVSRLMFMQRAHKAYAGTSTVCTGVASRLPGTVVHEVTRPAAETSPVVRIGHPAGVIETEVQVDRGGADAVVARATLGRTARRIMEGYVYVPDLLAR